MHTSHRIMTVVLSSFIDDQVIVAGRTFKEFYIFHSVRYDANVMM
jgi:hypothetical protein